MHDGPKEKKERALGVRLGLKGDRAMSPKSALTRKPYKPGAHGPRSRPKALSEFGLQLREKAKFKIAYGVNENNMKRLFTMATGGQGRVRRASARIARVAVGQRGLPARLGGLARGGAPARRAGPHHGQ